MYRRKYREKIMQKKRIIENLLTERNKLISILRVVDKRLQNAPQGTVRVVKHGKGYQYYYRKDPSEKSGTYISSSENKDIIPLVQKQYDKYIKDAAEKQLKVINRFLKEYNTDKLKEIYTLLPDGRKTLISPVELPDAEYMQKWLSFKYDKMGFPEEAPEHFSSNGERVRSKSEVIISDALIKYGIPYRYECPLKLGNTIVHPDFTILRLADREVLYWEHLGMMDNIDYCQKAVKKLRLYEANNIFPSSNLIVTMETSSSPINMTVIKNVIEAYCI